jgi:WD40 repeat protein
VTADGHLRYEWDFFVSYTRSDQAWAEWIAWILEEDGYRVLIQAWDFVPGSNWIRGMQAGTRDAARTIAVLSDSYLKSVYGSAEWQAALARDPDGSGRRLLVAWVEVCQRPGLLTAVVGIDLFGVPETAAKARLRAMVEAAITGRAKPTAPPTFPGEARAVPREPGFPGDDRDRMDEPPGGLPQDQGKDGVPASGGNWFQRQTALLQAAVVSGIFTVLAAVVAGIFALVSSHNSPPSPAPSTTPPTPSAHESSPGAGNNLIALPSPGVDTIAYSLDNKYLAAGNTNGVVRVWRTSAWQITDSMTDPGSRGVNSVAFNPASSLLAAGDANGHVYVWAHGHATVLNDPSGASIRSVAFSQDNQYLAVGDMLGTVNVWRTSTWRLASSMTDPGSTGVNSVAFNPANSLLAAGDANGHVYLWANGHATVLKDPDGAAVRSVVFAADNRAFVSGNSAGYIYVWHAGKGQPWLTRLSSRHYNVAETLHDPDTKGIESLAFNASTTTIAAADGNGRVYLWLFKLSGHLQYPTSNAALSVAYSPDDSHLAVASANGKVYVTLVKS